MLHHSFDSIIIYFPLSLTNVIFIRIGCDHVSSIHKKKAANKRQKDSAHFYFSLSPYYTCTQSKTLKIYGNTKEIGRGGKNLFFVCVCVARRLRCWCSPFNFFFQSDAIRRYTDSSVCMPDSLESCLYISLPFISLLDNNNGNARKNLQKRWHMYTCIIHIETIPLLCVCVCFVIKLDSTWHNLFL